MELRPALCWSAGAAVTAVGLKRQRLVSSPLWGGDSCDEGIAPSLYVLTAASQLSSSLPIRTLTLD